MGLSQMLMLVLSQMMMQSLLPIQMHAICALRPAMFVHVYAV
jgi:hypothetical protein